MENINIDMLFTGYLIFLRVTGLVIVAPFFSLGAIPRTVKIFVSIICSLLLFNAIPADAGVGAEALEGPMLIVLSLKEVLVGAAMGLVAQIVFAGLEMAGALISLQTALSFANMVDASSQNQSSILSTLFNMLGILLFLSIGGDKMLLNSLAKSYQIIPIGEANVAMAGPYMLEVATYLFIVGVQLTTPFIIVIFLIDVALAIFARIMPQANLMFIALPIKFGVDLLILMVMLPYFPTVFSTIFTHIVDFVQGIMQVLA